MIDRDRVDGAPEELLGTSRRPPWFILLPPALVACLWAVLPLLSEARGSGSAEVTLRFRVLDADTSAPVASATVRARRDHGDEPGDRAETSPAGVAVIRRRFESDFNSGSLVSRARKIVSFDRELVDVSAPGRATARERLSALVGRSWDLRDAPFDRVAIVRLARAP
ncbi:hypothetical protein [Paludisphaera sp.]|uniref:hypothetical protein n=1 Tax=Paludisphaera sp. TaxID=2017432 RepID=UPI00301BC107